MAEKLTSVGLDVGTTTTQLIVSSLTVENRASGFAVPEATITERNIVYQSRVYFTPLVSASLVDGQALCKIVEQEYRLAGITPDDVDTGAIIVTGETSRKENARTVLQSLSRLAGDFVVATAGPDLESVLAAKGAGATAYSEKTGKTLLHFDIGGGTSNLALIRDGHIEATGCLNVGGRLIRFDEKGLICYISPVLSSLTPLKIGDPATPENLAPVAQTLVHALEMAAGLRTVTPLLKTLTTAEAAESVPIPQEPVVISFSGGVADCIEKDLPFSSFGDLGATLGKAIKNSRLCKNAYILGTQTIRATVIGAGCHSAQLSGSTVFHRNISFPLKNLPVAVFSEKEQLSDDLAQCIARRRHAIDHDPIVLALPGIPSPTYAQLKHLSSQLLPAFSEKGVYLCLENDMAKALGQYLCLHLSEDTPILCIDRVQVRENSYLDVGAPVGPALPVIIKTLVLSKEN